MQKVSALMFKRIVISSLFLSSCAINSNLGDFTKNKIEKDGRSNSVDVYSQNEIWKYQNKNLGFVETDYCQNEKFGGVPSERQLNKELRYKTQLLGGNGIVYNFCQTRRNYMGCESYIKCQASAYIVEY